MGFNVDTTSDLSQSELEEVVDLYDVGYPGAGINYDLLSSNQDNPDDETYVISVDTDDGERYVAAGRINFSYEDMHAQLSDAVVHPDLRGKGLGKMLFNLRDNRAKERGNGRVYTWASTENPAVQHIASENDYVPSGVELETVDMQGDKVQNILMVDPDTLTGRSDTLYAPDSVTGVMESFIDGTELGENVDREVSSIDMDSAGESGYLVSAERALKGSISFGIGPVEEGRSLERDDVFRRVDSGTIQDAISDLPYNVPTKVAVNVNNPESASEIEAITEIGYRPTALHLDNPLSTDSEKEVHDQLIFEEIKDDRSLETTDDIADWLEGVETPAKPK